MAIPSQLSQHAQQIWWAGVRAALPAQLIPQYVRVTGKTLFVDEEAIDLPAIGRIAVVGAGKASGAMTVALEHALGPELLGAKNVTGWVNVPADCIVPSNRIHLHAARPAGVNEPTAEAVEGTRRILDIVASLRKGDLCFCLLSGGGSALLPAPAIGLALDDKIRITQALSAAGATIDELNTVRQQLSAVKGGGLSRACRAGRMISLVISDVLGDPLDLIASGPTTEPRSTPDDAIDVLKKLGVVKERALVRVVAFLEQQRLTTQQTEPARSSTVVTNIVIGNNALAVDAAGVEAERLGYSHAMISAAKSEGRAEEVGRHLAHMALRMRDEPGPNCLISGGEPTVRLVDESVRGRGGRNQQLALAALSELGICDRIALLSGGTDGEDGPTDAAGAMVTSDVVERAASLSLAPQDYLDRNDAYNFFAAAGGLFKTGPTHTNVCDLRVVTVDQSHHH